MTSTARADRRCRPQSHARLLGGTPASYWLHVVLPLVLAWWLLRGHARALQRGPGAGGGLPGARTLAASLALAAGRNTYLALGDEPPLWLPAAQLVAALGVFVELAVWAVGVNGAARRRQRQP